MQRSPFFALNYVRSREEANVQHLVHSKETASAARTLVPTLPSRPVLGITPEQVAHRTVVRNFLKPIQRGNLVDTERTIQLDPALISEETSRREDRTVSHPPTRPRAYNQTNRSASTTLRKTGTSASTPRKNHISASSACSRGFHARG